MQKLKIISFSLWGVDLKYVNGAISNAKLALEFYSDWICKFYISKDTLIYLPDKITELRSFKNVSIVEMNEEGDWRGMFWRFYPCADKDVDVMISRDTDSRLSFREKLAVDEWLKSDKDFHIMRDHHGHGTAILGGMWGARNQILLSMMELIDNYDVKNYWQIDQEFLAKAIYPAIKNNVFVHDPFFEGYPFPSKRNDFEFVGDVFDQYDKRDTHFKNDLIQYLNRNNFKMKITFLKNRIRKMLTIIFK